MREFILRIAWEMIFMLNLMLFIVLIMAIVSKSIIKDGSHNKKLNVSLAVAVILPAVIALPGALETRFTSIVYCIMYITLFMKTNYIKMIGWIKSNELKSFVIIVLIFFVLCMNACHLLDEIEHVNLDFRGNVYYE